MLKILIKKQLEEVFKNYFYDAKKNRMRSKRSIIAWILFLVLILGGVLGGMATVISINLCDGLLQAGMGWLYFLLTGGIAVLFGAFGSVFNTYVSLYLPKDNDLLLSLPIPARTILLARLATVWMMGTLYLSAIFIPALVVYWIKAEPAITAVIGGIILYLDLTLLVLVMSCLLGWVVAKLSLKWKNKSFITVLVSLLFVGGYYFVYFKANDLIKNLLMNAESYGEKVKGTVYALYLFGRIGEGDIIAAVVGTAVMAAACAVIWKILSMSFLTMVTSSGRTEHVRYEEKPVKEKKISSALLAKEFSRFTSSATYMLNCGMGTLLIPALGVFLIIKGSEICAVIDEALSVRPDLAAVLVSTVLCLLTCMNYMVTPSISLEGKSLWILQSLPVEPKTILHSKMKMQLILTAVPMLFAALCGAFVIPSSAEVKIAAFVMPMVYVFFSTVFGLFLGIRMPFLHWTNENAPIKQSGSILIALLGGWGICIAIAGLYLLIGYRIGAALYLECWCILFMIITLILYKWLNKEGAKAFSEL